MSYLGWTSQLQRDDPNFFVTYDLYGLPVWNYRQAPLNIAPAPAPPPVVPVVTGVDPVEVANALYGKVIPISALGLARIGTAGLIWGPEFNNGNASFAVSFGFPANPSGTRRIYEISLDGKVAWSLASGSAAGALDAAGFVSEAFTARFYSGTLTQTADSLTVAKDGTEAVAYRPQMMLWFENLPVGPFNGKVPFVSAVIGDTTGGATPADGLNIGDALERVAASPWIEMDSTKFEATGTADIVQAMILTEDQTFIELLQTMSSVYRTLDILQTDKLRVNDRGSTVTADLTLDRDRICADDGVTYFRREQSSTPREFELLTIDPEADYVFVPSKVGRPLAPVPVTSSVDRQSVMLPVVIGPTTRASLATYAKYVEENARKKVRFKAMLYGYELEPGDLVALRDLRDGFEPYEVMKVTDTLHGANYEVEITAEAILKCGLPTDVLVEPVSYYDSAQSGSIYTFNNVDLGAVSEDRLILVSGAIKRSLSPGNDVTQVTINGNVCSDLVTLQAHDGGGSGNTAITVFMASAVVPTGTTATVVVTGGASGCFIHITRLTGYNSATPHDSDSASSFAGTPSLNIDVPDDGICIAVYAGNGTSDVTWTGLSTENVDQQVDPEPFWASVASQSSMSGQSGRTITATSANAGWEAIMVRTYA